MQQREKNLMLITGGVVVAAIGLVMFNNYSKPIDDATADRNDALDKVDALELQEMAILRAKQRLEGAKERSLPGDQKRAQALYQQWLTDLAEQVAGFQARVTPENPRASREKSKTNGTTGKAYYYEIPVKITGEATMAQLRRFLYAFYKTDLMQEIESLRIASPANEGDPAFGVTITATGMSMADAPDRGRTLFPRTTLKTRRLRSSTTRIEVEDASAFPKTGPFRIRIDGEYARVTKVAGSEWTIVRGLDLTRARSHREGDIVELAPATEKELPITQKQLEQLVSNSPFTKPAPPATYEPSIDIAGDYEFPRGESLKLDLTAEDLDRERGPVRFVLEGDTPKGILLKRDGDKAQVTWNPGDAEPSRATFKIKMIQGEEDEPPVYETEEEITVTYNTEPVIEEIAEQTLSPGTAHAMVIKATDADMPKDEVKLTASDLPEGATFDAATGMFKWTPTADHNDQTVEVTFTATDKLEAEVSQTVSLKVGYDLAKVTILSSISLGFGPNGEAEASLLDTVNRKVINVMPGSEIDYAGIKGKVVEVDFQGDLIKIATAKKLFELKLEGNLRDMRDITPAVPQKRTALKAPRP